MSDYIIGPLPTNGGNVTVQLPGGGRADGIYNPVTNTVTY